MLLQTRLYVKFINSVFTGYRYPISLGWGASFDISLLYAILNSGIIKTMQNYNLQKQSIGSIEMMMELLR